MLLPPGTPIEIIRAVIQGLDDTFLATQNPETRLLVLEAVVESIKKTYPVTIAAGCLMIVATLFLEQVKVQREIGANSLTLNSPKDRVEFK